MPIGYTPGQAGPASPEIGGGPGSFTPNAGLGPGFGIGLLDSQGRGGSPSGSPGLLMNIEHLVSQATFAAGWNKRTYDRPVVLVGISQTNQATPTAALGPLGSLYFAPYNQPNTIEEARRSGRRFIAHLDHAGDWYVNFFAPSAGALSRLKVAVIDATNPITAAMYLSLFGCNTVFHSSTPIIGTAVTGLLSSGMPRQNFHRVALAIRNGSRPVNDATSGGGFFQINYRLDGLLPTSNNSDTTPGFRLTPGQTDVLVGDTLSLAPVEAISVSVGGGGFPWVPLAADRLFWTEFSL